MKVLAGLVLCIGSAMAFADTAPFYSGINALSSDYIVQASEVASLVHEHSHKLCSSSLKEKLFIYRVRNLEAKKPESDKLSYVRHLHYDSVSDLDFPLSDKCVVKYVNSVGSEVGDANVVVVDIDDGESHSYHEFTNGSTAVLVQGKPMFLTRKQTLKETLEDMHLDLDKIVKRGYESDEEEAEAAILEEIEADFRAAESMVAEEQSYVTAFAEEKEGDAQAAGTSSSKATSNLFTKYQFFTPGVFLSLIVSLFLLYVITTAVSWVTSIETSYNAFEKQVDYEKKTE